MISDLSRSILISMDGSGRLERPVYTYQTFFKILYPI